MQVEHAENGQRRAAGLPAQPLQHQAFDVVARIGHHCAMQRQIDRIERAGVRERRREIREKRSITACATIPEGVAV